MEDLEFAPPRVFISSTCTDLSDARAVLKATLVEWGFDVLLSEDFPYHPLDHPHDSAFRQVDRSDIFLLIIRRRFGTTHYLSREFSITQLEYFRAIRTTKPVYIYIERDLLAAVGLFESNPTADFRHIVDDVRVLSWVSELSRAVSRRGFTTVQDILRDLRIQLPAYLGYCLRLASMVSAGDTTSASSWILQGNALGKRGLYSLASFCYDRALAIAPTNTEALEWKIVCLKQLGNLEEAERLAREALVHNPHSEKIRWNLQHVLLKMGRVEESIAIGEELLDIADHDYRVWRDLGEAYETLWNRSKAPEHHANALRCIETAHSLNSNQHRTREVLARLRAQAPSAVS